VIPISKGLTRFLPIDPQPLLLKRKNLRRSSHAIPIRIANNQLSMIFFTASPQRSPLLQPKTQNATGLPLRWRLPNLVINIANEKRNS
jgi:hypothetical protein